MNKFYSQFYVYYFRMMRQNQIMPELLLFHICFWHISGFQLYLVINKVSKDICECVVLLLSWCGHREKSAPDAMLRESPPINSDNTNPLCSFSAV